MNTEIVVQPNISETNRDLKGRFVKGNPGSPGRPKKENTILSILKDMGDEELPTGKTREQALCEIVWRYALAGDRQYVDIVLDRILGKPKQSVDVQADNVISVEYVNTFLNSTELIEGEVTDVT